MYCFENYQQLSFCWWLLIFSQVLSAFLLIPLSIALGVLLGWHIYLILQNKTTIEVVLFLFSCVFDFISSIARLRISLALVRLCSSANQFCGIEQYHEGVRAMWLAEKGGQVYKHPYDIGAYENLTLVIICIFYDGQYQSKVYSLLSFNCFFFRFWVRTYFLGSALHRGISVLVCVFVQLLIQFRLHLKQNLSQDSNRVFPLFWWVQSKRQQTFNFTALILGRFQAF